MRSIDIDATLDWLIGGIPGARTPVDVVGRIGPELLQAGIPLARTEAFVRTLHPHIAGRSFLWVPGRPVDVRENTFSYLNSPEFQETPAAEVFQTGAPVRVRLTSDGDALARFPALAVLDRDGFTDFLAGPLTFLSGQIHAITFATRAPGGFSEAHIEALLRVLPPLSRIAEILALSRTATNLLNAYVGHDAGERILSGQIQRGETTTLRAVLWFSDLRGFTSISSVLTPNEVIRMLNDLFDCQVPAIEAHGGQVLKFMGDGLLAVFPVEPVEPAEVALASARTQCDRALRAASASFGRLAELNRRRAATGLEDMRFGLALHVGEMAYGNIGGSARQDFTCIGAAVNLAARLEGLTAKLGRPLVVSDVFAGLVDRPFESLGRFELKGVPEPAEVFAPVD